MRISKLGKVATGLVAAGAVVCLTALPAAANTRNVETVAGILTINDMFGSPVTTIDLSDPGEPCTPAASSSATATGSSTSGTLTASINSHSAVNIGGDDFVATLSTSLSGTYTDATSNYTASGSATATLVKSDSSDPCTPLEGAGPCTIEVGGLSVSGVISHASAMPTLSTNDTASISGGSGPFSVLVDGDAEDCGILIGAGNGDATITGGSLKVLP